VWAYAIGIGTNPTIAHTVTEWAPPTIHDETGIVFFGSALIVAGYLARRKEPIAWPQLALLATFFVVGLQASRGIVWWALVFPVGVASLVAWKPTTEEPRGSPLMNALLVTSICATAVIVMPFWRAGPSTQPPAYLIQAPASLVDAMASALPPGSRLFVSQTYASWFEFALPSMPVFVDSRIELFPTSIWDEYLDVRDAREGWQATLDGWDVDAVVINPDQDGAFIEPMNDDPAWRLAFHDAQGYLFVRS
jgi:hypothetical protein